MSLRKFISGLLMTTLIQTISSGLMIWLSVSIRSHLGFIITSIVTMMLFCIMMYMAARVMAKSTMTGLYIQLIMIAVFLKMLVCLTLIIGYTRGFEPSDNSFIWPFLIIYITSTIYEVIFLEKIGRQKQTPVS